MILDVLTTDELAPIITPAPIRVPAFTTRMGREPRAAADVDRVDDYLVVPHHPAREDRLHGAEHHEGPEHDVVLQDQATGANVEAIPAIKTSSPIRSSLVPTSVLPLARERRLPQRPMNGRAKASRARRTCRVSGSQFVISWTSQSGIVQRR